MRIGWMPRMRLVAWLPALFDQVDGVVGRSGMKRGKYSFPKRGEGGLYRGWSLLVIAVVAIAIATTSFLKGCAFSAYARVLLYSSFERKEEKKVLIFFVCEISIILLLLSLFPSSYPPPK